MWKSNSLPPVIFFFLKKFLWSMCLPARVALLGNYKGKPEPCVWHRRKATGGSHVAWPSRCLPPPWRELCAAQRSPRAGSPVHMGQATAAGALCSVLY